MRIAAIVFLFAASVAFSELTESEQNRLAAALAVIEPRLGTNYAAHSNFGILLGDARAKENEIGGGERIALTIPIYERVAHALTNSMRRATITNGGN